MEIRDNYTTIRTREELKRAAELGLTVYFSHVSNTPDRGFVDAAGHTGIYVEDEGAFRDFRWRVLGKHDLSPAKPEPEPKDAGFKIGDIVEILETPAFSRVEPGTLARVAVLGNNYDKRLLGLEGPNGEKLWDGVDDLLWVRPEDIAHAAAPEVGDAEFPGTRLAEDEALLRDLFGDDEPPAFRITVTIEADSAEGYKAALTALGEGV